MSQAVLAGVDGSESSLVAADWAAVEAAVRGVPLRLVHGSPPLPGPAVPGSATDRLRELGELLLERVAADLRDRHPDVEVLCEQAGDAPDTALVAASSDAGLLVVGMRGTGGFDGLAVGRVALRTAAAASCPVVLVPERLGTFAERTRAEHGAAPVVGGLNAHRAAGEVADFAFLAAEAYGTGLRMVHAWEFPAEAVSSQTLVVTEEDRATWEDQEELQLSDALRPWRERYPDVVVRTDVMLMHPAEALLHVSQGAALLVVGRRTRSRSPEGRLGPVTCAVLQHAGCPVAVVPHDG
ncbi:universal stress protein [Streptomyces anandii]|uniref:universal stress protein n=1 Tax=Streptomyces anandii TaxID=285454 RepID=UPI0016761B64|nr:universal stress protein [Streptomyces anandii]